MKTLYRDEMHHKPSFLIRSSSGLHTSVNGNEAVEIDYHEWVDGNEDQQCHKRRGEHTHHHH